MRITGVLALLALLVRAVSGSPSARCVEGLPISVNDAHLVQPTEDAAKALSFALVTLELVNFLTGPRHLQGYRFNGVDESGFPRWRLINITSALDFLMTETFLLNGAFFKLCLSGNIFLHIAILSDLLCHPCLRDLFSQSQLVP